MLRKQFTLSLLLQRGCFERNPLIKKKTEAGLKIIVSNVTIEFDAKLHLMDLVCVLLQVLQGPDSSPFIRSMLTPTICPKPIPGVCHMHLQTHICTHMKCTTSLSPWLASFVWPPPLSLLSSFNRIDIPPYESYDKLYDKLLTAIEETCGFAVEWESHWRVCLRVNRCNRVQDSDHRHCDVPTGSLRARSVRPRPACSLPPLTALHILPLSISVWTAARESSPCHVFFIQLFVWGYFCFCFGVVCVKIQRAN